MQTTHDHVTAAEELMLTQLGKATKPHQYRLWAKTIKYFTLFAVGLIYVKTLYYQCYIYVVAHSVLCRRKIARCGVLLVVIIIP